jgi:hypothetical protein
LYGVFFLVILIFVKIGKNEVVTGAMRSSFSSSSLFEREARAATPGTFGITTYSIFAS